MYKRNDMLVGLLLRSLSYVHTACCINRIIGFFEKLGDKSKCTEMEARFDAGACVNSNTQPITYIIVIYVHIHFCSLLWSLRFSLKSTCETVGYRVVSLPVF